MNNGDVPHGASPLFVLATGSAMVSVVVKGSILKGGRIKKRVEML